LRPGAPVGAPLVAAARRAASCRAGDPPARLQQWRGPGEWLLTPDRRFLVECAESARHVKLWSIPDGHLVSEFAPRLGQSSRHQGRLFVSPQGRVSLVAWDLAGTFSVWDVWAGRRLATFRATHAPGRGLVNEEQWRLTAGGEDAPTAGRYRRPVATVWDLTTGTRVERVTDDLSRRLAGYQARSTVDRFGDVALSPCG